MSAGEVYHDRSAHGRVAHARRRAMRWSLAAPRASSGALVPRKEVRDPDAAAQVDSTGREHNQRSGVTSPPRRAAQRQWWARAAAGLRRRFCRSRCIHVPCPTSSERTVALRFHLPPSNAVASSIASGPGGRSKRKVCGWSPGGLIARTVDHDDGRMPQAGAARSRRAGPGATSFRRQERRRAGIKVFAAEIVRPEARSASTEAVLRR